MKSPRTIGERVKWARELTRLSARQLAHRAGLKSETHVGLIETGRRKGLGGDTVAKLARALGVSMEWLQSGDGKRPDERALRAIADEPPSHP